MSLCEIVFAFSFLLTCQKTALYRFQTGKFRHGSVWRGRLYSERGREQPRWRRVFRIKNLTGTPYHTLCIFFAGFLPNCSPVSTDWVGLCCVKSSQPKLDQ
jgi:hypothetical protein